MAEPIPEMTFLTVQDLIEITGAKHASKQIAILERYKIPHIVDANGKPKLTWYQYNNAQMYATQASNDGPDFGALDRI